jgi:hypothetical protein
MKYHCLKWCMCFRTKTTETIIDVKKGHVKRFLAVEQALGKTTLPQKYSPQPMPHLAIHPLHTRRASLPRQMPVSAKHCEKTVPVIHGCQSTAYPQTFYPLPQLFRRLDVPIPPRIRRAFPTFPATRVNKP